MNRPNLNKVIKCCSQCETGVKYQGRGIYIEMVAVDKNLPMTFVERECCIEFRVCHLVDFHKGLPWA